MTFHFQQAIRALILLAFTGLIFKLHVTGEITKLINPKYVGLSQTASVLFLVLFFIQITRIWSTNNESHHQCDHQHDSTCSHQHDHGNKPFTFKKFISYTITVFPLLTGFLLSPKVLDASIVDKKGGMAIFANQSQSTAYNADEFSSNTINDSEDPFAQTHIIDNEFEKPDEEIEDISFIDHYAIPDLEYKNVMSKAEYDQLIQGVKETNKIIMDEPVFAAYYDEISFDIETYKGKEIELTGFVYKEEGLKENQLVLSRFVITHCVADASIIGFVTEIAEAQNIEQDTWIRATGVLDVTGYNGIELPVVKVTNWDIIDEPDEPYLYPITIRIL
ncbi:TIGR03943 family protein [Bacillus sp. B15-48]|uniref:TIGR03943 family putative permease subunit n=1 Tax=Bacillus sp. B15-48 TaxID=1548601 RepID=UPI00193ED6E0|nr:TIGR03943 family protein [Bacillus sp. B15-48]MBM4762892.1 TIGR03943 family protein [Bacillus sp. B15-48]